mmetsp:Transcript_22562/g.38243  ORF Transcript_22562/g.38243 Transcript_22562/m.38243 type:complete len:201 (+) Transcript_22562:1934-2536(+)
MSNRKSPPEYGVSAGPVIIAFNTSMRSSSHRTNIDEPTVNGKSSPNVANSSIILANRFWPPACAGNAAMFDEKWCRHCPSGERMLIASKRRSDNCATYFCDNSSLSSCFKSLIVLLLLLVLSLFLLLLLLLHIVEDDGVVVDGDVLMSLSSASATSASSTGTSFLSGVPPADNAISSKLLEPPSSASTKLNRLVRRVTHR